MGTYKNKAYTLRLDNEIMEKMRELAQKEDRPLSKEIERAIKQYLETANKEKINYVNINNMKNSNLKIQ